MTDLGGVALGVIAGGALAPVGVLVARRGARARLQRRHELLLAAATAVAGGACASWPPGLFAPSALVVVVAIPAAAVDAVEHRIPNRLSLSLGAGVLVALTCTSELSQLLCAVGGALAWGGLLFATFLVTGQPGPGDVKLAPSLGALAGWVGWQALASTIVVAYLLAAAVGLAGVASGRLSLRTGRLPLAPPMVAATIGLVTVFACIRP